MDKRKIEEKHFHDMLRQGQFGQRWSLELEEIIKKNKLWSNMKFYAIERRSREAVEYWYRSNCPNKKVLDYCCGNGDDAFLMRECGAREVVGIDISEVSILNCTKRAQDNGYENCFFYVMDAENMSFDDNSFDIVSEYGALHHLNLRKAYSEISRILRPGGRCICTETLGHNPFIHMYRKRTMHLRTEWEVDHILKKKEINMAGEYFNRVEVLGFYHLLNIAAVPFRKTKMFERILKVLEAVDDVILRVPVIKWQAWQVVFELSDPKS